MKKGLFSVVLASVVFGGAAIAFAGAYGEAEQPEEIPAPAPAPPPAPEPEAPKVMRLFDGFLADAETTRGIWAELGSIYGVHYYDNAGDTEAVNTYLHLSYGQDMFEVGAQIPYIYAHQGNNIGEEDAFGDLRVYGKGIYHAESWMVGGGLIMTFPTGDDGMGTAEYGFEPFVTGGGYVGPVSIRGHVGYDVFTSHDNLPEEDVYDHLNVNLAVLGWALADKIVVRGELVYQHLTNAFDLENPLSLVPGADFYVPIGSNSLIFRPTLAVGLTQDAPDWQAGLGIAFEAGV